MAYGKIKADTLVYDNSGSDTEVTISSLGNKADLASPTFTGTVTIPTASANDNTTKAASTAYVQTELGDYATTASPTFTGTPAAPTAAANTNTTQIATTAYVQTELGDYATLAAPALTGTATGVNLTLSGNLTVNGTTTTINSTTLTVDDKNIELGTVDTPTDTTADGGGITLKGATDKTFNWVDATDAWTSSEHIHLGDNKKLLVGTGSDIVIQHTGSVSEITNSVGELQIKNIANSALKLYTNNNVRVTIANDGHITTSNSISDDKGNVRSIPANSQSSAYVAVAADAGKVISISSGGVTINGSVFSAGDAVTIVNNSGSDQTITSGSGGMTIHNTADAATGNRTLAGRGMATLWFLSNGTAYISGAGLS